MSRHLGANEARVLAVLVEKQATVPDTYPLSLNALVAGCNQKTAREPVMSVSEAQALEAIEGLRSLSLVNEVSGSRVTRYEHNMGRGLALPSQSVALLSTLMLRGPQTAAELRANAERLHRFADTSSVEAFLDELAGKSPSRVVKLPRAPGAREARWAHLLCGEVVVADAPAPVPGDSDDIEALRAEVAELKALVMRMAAELGLEIKEELMRFEIPDEKKLVYEMTIPIRWGDMDAMGHVNNTVYFRYLEIIRVQWMHSVGGAPNPQGFGPVIVNTFCNFIKQLEYPGDVLTKHYVTNPGRTSFDAYITLERTDQPGVIYAAGGATTVWVDFKQQKSVPLPDWLRELVSR